MIKETPTRSCVQCQFYLRMPYIEDPTLHRCRGGLRDAAQTRTAVTGAKGIVKDDYMFVSSMRNWGACGPTGKSFRLADGILLPSEYAKLPWYKKLFAEVAQVDNV